jgi:hypothetical protein
MDPTPPLLDWLWVSVAGVEPGKLASGSWVEVSEDSGDGVALGDESENFHL